MVTGECNRDYLLDRGMPDAELAFRCQDDHISKYRLVPEHFDAVNDRPERRRTDFHADWTCPPRYFNRPARSVRGKLLSGSKESIGRGW